jgi:hypothetical protein
MVVVAFFHVFITVLDRIIYLKQNRTNITNEYFYYNNSTGRRLKPADYQVIIDNSPDSEKYFTKVTFQHELTNYPLIFKYVLHVFLVVCIHGFIFWYLPMIGNTNMHNNYYCDTEKRKNKDCNDFLYNGYLITFYIFYLIYFIFSSIQIQFGLLDMRKKSLLMRGDNVIYSSSFKVFNSIPFLYELKLLIDWSFTPTALDLFKWIKFESVYDVLFTTHCYMKAEFKRKIGEKVGWVNKTTLGYGGFIILLLILLGPLLLFSNLNPTNIFNNINSAEVELTLSFEDSRVFYNYTLYTNKQASIISDLSNHMNIWDLLRLSQPTETKNYPKDQIQVTVMPNVSDTNWVLAEPHIETIKNYLTNYLTGGKNIYFYFSYTFTRKVILYFKAIVP